jgi:hypothetical protein
MKFKIYLMLPKHNKKKNPKNETVCEWGRHWNNDDKIPGKMYRLEAQTRGKKKLEEESSRFTAARQWRWIQKWASKIATYRLERCARRFKNGFEIPKKKSNRSFQKLKAIFEK